MRNARPGPRGACCMGSRRSSSDNYDTADLPTTAGSFMLKDSIPPQDVVLVKKLRDAGAIILAKVNLSEFASGGRTARSAGETLNPHDLTRTPAGSSGGTGAGIAAVFAPLGVGTDTAVSDPQAIDGQRCRRTQADA